MELARALPLQRQARPLGNVIGDVEVAEAQEVAGGRVVKQGIVLALLGVREHVFPGVAQDLGEAPRDLDPSGKDLPPRQIDFDREILDEAHLGLLDLDDLRDLAERAAGGARRACR